MKADQNRRTFIKSAALASAGLSLGQFDAFGKSGNLTGKRVGIIGLDTSHSIAFTKALNASEADSNLKGYRIVAAYPYGSKTIESSFSRIAGYTDEIKQLGVTIEDSIEALLEKVDVVMLETNDGRLHLEQAQPVLKAGKRLFIDKPIAASLKDTLAIFETSSTHDVPVFSSSSLRYVPNLADIKSGKSIGKVYGVDTYSPATLETTHPDLSWYGIHGIEMLYAVLGTGCERVSRTHNEGTDIVVGTWSDGRIGTFRGIRAGANGYGGTAFGEKGQAVFDKYSGYTPLLYEIINFFESGIPPVDPQETIEMITFIEAADISKNRNGAAVTLREIGSAQ